MQVDWDDDEKTIIYAAFRSDWTWEEARQIDQQVMQMADAVEHPVSVIAGFPANSKAPQLSDSPVPHLRHILKFRHPRIEIIVTVGMDRFIRHVIETLSHTHGLQSHRIYYAETKEQARVFIARWRQQNR